MDNRLQKYIQNLQDDDLFQMVNKEVSKIIRGIETLGDKSIPDERKHLFILHYFEKVYRATEIDPDKYYERNEVKDKVLTLLLGKKTILKGKLKKKVVSELILDVLYPVFWTLGSFSKLNSSNEKDQQEHQTEKIMIFHGEMQDKQAEMFYDLKATGKYRTDKEIHNVVAQIFGKSPESVKQNIYISDKKKKSLFRKVNKSKQK